MGMGAKTQPPVDASKVKVGQAVEVARSSGVSIPGGVMGVGSKPRPPGTPATGTAVPRPTDNGMPTPPVVDIGARVAAATSAAGKARKQGLASGRQGAVFGSSKGPGNY